MYWLGVLVCIITSIIIAIGVIKRKNFSEGEIIFISIIVIISSLLSWVGVFLFGSIAIVAYLLLKIKEKKS